MNQQTLIPAVENDTLTMQYISEMLLDLGMKPNLKGFNYLREAIILHPEIIRTNKRFNYIYTVIAEKCGVSAGSVERAIRTSIEAIWYSDKINLSHKLFECSYINADHPPTNAMFIATMAEIIKLELRKKQLCNL